MARDMYRCIWMHKDYRFPTSTTIALLTMWDRPVQPICLQNTMLPIMNELYSDLLAQIDV